MNIIVILLTFKFVAIYMQSCICIGSVTISWHCKMHARYSEYLPGSSLYIDLGPG